MGKRKPVPELDISELASWPTKRLLGRLNSLRKLEENPESSDMDESEIEAMRSNGISFKCDPNWRDAYTELKTVLDAREHVE